MGNVAIPTPVGTATRLGALLDDREDGRVVDLHAAGVARLERETEEPTPREFAALRVPPDMLGWLRGTRGARGGQRASRTLARMLAKARAAKRLVYEARGALARAASEAQVVPRLFDLR